MTVHYSEHDGKEKVASDHFDFPPDVANGLTLTLLKNLRPNDPPTTVSMVATTPKARLVKLAISPQGEDPFSTTGAKRMATHYVIKVEIGGIEGKIAPLLGKHRPISTSGSGCKPALLRWKARFFTADPSGEFN